MENIILNGDMTKAVFSKTGIRQESPLSSFLFSIVLEILVDMIRPQHMRMKGKKNVS